jgi:transcriptional regulator with XRE-family HTH domain
MRSKTTTDIPTPYEADQVVHVLSPLWSAAWMGTSDHFGVRLGWILRGSTEHTSWAGPFAVRRIRPIANEVLELRDRIIAVSGLTKQDIARALGVDRRSLSGYVTGEIRPTESRVESLRALAELVETLRPRFGDRLRDVLRCDTGHGTPLDLIGSGRLDLTDGIAAAAAIVMPTPRITVRRRQHREPLYLLARERWADRLDLPAAGGVVRNEAVYEQDLSKASPSQPTTGRRPRRKRI